MTKKSAKKEEKPESQLNLEKALIENFIGLQKVMANMSSKFEELSVQIAKLLELFEITAKAMAEKDFEKLQGSDNKELLDKIDLLLDQNKTIARGMSLMTERGFEPRNTQPEMEGYSKSINSPKFKQLPRY